jgi:hypothetical protein
MMGFITFLFAGCTAFAAWSMAAGNPTAINGVIGAGIGTVVIGACWWLERGM